MTEPIITKYKSFAEVQRVTLKIEQGGELLILLKANLARTFRIEYYLNGHLIRPEWFTGKTKATYAWSTLVGRLISANPNFKLTPEGQEENEPNSLSNSE